MYQSYSHYTIRADTRPQRDASTRDFEHQYWRCRRYAYVGSQRRLRQALLRSSRWAVYEDTKTWEYSHLVEVSDFDKHDDEDRCAVKIYGKEGRHTGHGRYSEVLRESRLSTYVATIPPPS